MVEEKDGVLARLDGIDTTLRDIKGCMSSINELQITSALQTQRLGYMDSNIAALRADFMAYQTLVAAANSKVQTQLSTNKAAGVAGRSKVAWWIIGVLVTLNIATLGLLVSHII
jgi:hypothetical protein